MTRGLQRRQIFGDVDYRGVVRGLVFENAQLGFPVFADRAITIEMVGREVEPDADLGMKIADRFELKRTDLHRQHGKVFILARRFDERFADVPAGDGALAAGVQHLRDQFRRRRLAVCPGDADDRDAQIASQAPARRSSGMFLRENFRPSGSSGSIPGLNTPRS